MKLNPFLMSISLIVAAGPLAGIARAETGPQGIRFLPDVAAQFDALRPELDPVGWHMDGVPDPSFCRHLQAIVRVEAPDGTPYFLVTRSGNLPEAVEDIPFDGGCIDGDGENGQGHLIVVRMGERDKNGERLRSNRLSKLGFIEQTQPTPGDKAVIFYTVTEDGLVLGNGPDGITPPKTFSHPGGMQVVGHTLALAIEAPCQDSQTFPAILCEPTTVKSMIQFYDVTDPEHPVLKSSFSPAPVMGKKAGVVGITPLPDGRNLLVSAGGKGEKFFFFRSNAVDLSSRDLQWEPVNSTPGPIVRDPHQTLTFLRQGNINGQLFIAAARGFAISETILSPSHADFIDLYSVACNPADCAPGATITLDPVVSNKFMDNGIPSSFGSRQVNMAAASAFYVSPGGELIFYATEHDNDGPGRTVKAGEYPHRDVVRDDSPTLLPNADIDKESYEVEEGDSITLSGRGRPPKTRAFIQVFQETGFRDFCTVIDFDDVDLDDFDNLGRFCLYGPEGGIRSWIWFAPEGCSIRATHTQLGGSKTLKGTGHIERDLDLAQVRNDQNTNDMDLRVDKITFEGGCDAFYDTGADLEWDLNLDGTFETTGDEVTFDSRGFDGPSVVNVPVQARHPGSTVPGPGVAQVVVRNLQPVIRDIVLTNADPFALVGLPVTLRFPFSDAGTPDHQTASVAWGDGVTDPNTSFVSFKDAFGGVIGEGVATHVYRSAAQLELNITVTDDDGDAERDGTQIKVLTVEQGLNEAIVLLDDLIAHTTDPGQRKILEKAAKALYGNPRGSNGAQLMLRTGNKTAAIAFLNTAIGLLQDASARGAQTGTIPAILNQLIAALKAGV